MNSADTEMFLEVGHLFIILDKILNTQCKKFSFLLLFYR
jgi:hypothetical protein